jgi:uncharacterized protein YgiM (DUF1202 family)
MAKTKHFRLRRCENGFSRMGTRTLRTILLACVIGVLAYPAAAHAQRGRGRGGQGTGASAEAPKPTGERVRIKAGHANVHSGPTSGNEVLLLAVKGTVLPVLARRGEWVQVGLSPELRKTGMVMRWYKNENNGWIHDSMLEVVAPADK